MKRLILLATLVALSVSFDLHSLAAMEWNVYKLEFGKEYSSVAEEHAHLSAFLDSKQDIAEHNIKYHKGEVSYTLGINEFSDMLPDYKNPRLGLKVPKDHKRKGYQYLPLGDHIKVPNSIDWRTMGAVTPVKDQGQCGSCWAFSATGSLEGQHFRKSGELVSLSEQQLIDCIIADYGCDTGGMPDDAFQYVKTNGGLDTEISYPYLAENGTCHFMNSSIGATDTGFVDVGANEPEIYQATATIGPISVGIFANTHSFMRYKSGIYDDAKCNGDIDHGVLIVGYGTEEGKDFWIVKNSWGPGWGEDGYIRIARGKNMCNINSAASYPLV